MNLHLYVALDSLKITYCQILLKTDSGPIVVLFQSYSFLTKNNQFLLPSSTVSCLPLVTIVCPIDELS